MANIPRLRTYSTRQLVDLALSGDIRVPAFQRPFVWHASHVIDFFGSLLQGYPVGMLLCSEQRAPAETLAFGPVVVDAPARERALWAVDGHQRITALVGALGPTDDASDPRFEVGVDLNTRQVSGASDHASATWVPLRTLFDPNRRFTWVRENSNWLSEHHHQLLDELSALLTDTLLPVHVLTTGDPTQLAEVFRRLNTSTRSLTDRDLARTRRPASDTPFERAGFGRVSARQLQLIRQAVRTLAPEPATQQVLVQIATTLRRDVHIPHLRLLPHESTLFGLAAFLAKFGTPQSRTAELVRRWVWRMAIVESVPHPEASLSRVAAADSPDAAILSLLETAPTEAGDWCPDLMHHTDWQASDRLNALGLWSAGPRHLDENHAPISTAEIFDSDEPLPRVHQVDDWPGILLHPPMSRPDFARQDPDTLASHLLDTRARDLLLDNDYEGFGAHRAELLSRAVRATVDRNAEWGARDSFSARSLLGKAAHDA
ncbi:DUF262 domain-containing protein [Saccharothrix sp. AJ9571]|nr:DUF262 domain-containing protein [Saccharothrix sp. AJ9571]